MPGAYLESGSPSSSDDESVVGSGGAPLYTRSPESPSSFGEEAAGFQSKTSSAATGPDHPSDGNLSVWSGLDPEKDPRTPSDQEIQTPEPVKPRRSFSKSTLRAAAKVFAAPTSTSARGIPPSLSLASYPSPGAAPQSQPSLSALVAVDVSASQDQGRSSLPDSATHAFISAMRAMTLHAAEDNIHPVQKTHREQTCKLQARIWGLRQGMYRQNLIPPEFLQSFDYDVQELINNTVKMNKAVDQLAAELKKALSEQERIRGLEATVRDLEGGLKDWKERTQNAEKNLASLAGRSDEDMRTIQFLKEQLRQNEMARTILQDQVNGKRNLWLNVHNDPQERAAVLGNLARSSTPLSGQTFADHNYAPSLRAPTSIRSSSSHTANVHHGINHSGNATPGNVNTTGFYYGGAGQLVGPLVSRYTPFQPIPQSHSGPAVYQGHPHHQRRLSSATAASGRSSVGYTASRQSGGPTSLPPSGPRRNSRAPSIITETGSPKERTRNTPRSLMRVDPEDSDSLKWADEFQSLFALIYGFCASYFHELPVLDGEWKRQVQFEANGQLWDYLCKICQTGQEQEPGENAMRLLKDHQSRPYLMQRLILQHILVFICSYEGWKDYSEDVDEEMEKLEEHLKKIDPPKMYDRQMIIDRRAQLVAEMCEGSNAAAFKNFKLTQHHQYLKTMVAPFLARRRVANVTNEAFYDLFAITTTAWELSGKLFRSRLAFQHVWNDAGVRFSTETHEPLDCAVDRLTLQHEHCRVRFCATPAVTMRTDQGMTIDTKNILKAGVLMMGY